jgi:cytoskeletal protein CcmA (bactofilin family)
MVADTTPTKSGEFATIIGADAHFKGELSFTGGVRIDGQFEGSITTSGVVLVSREGRVKAEVKAGSAVIEGHIEGNVHTEDRADIRSTGQLRGDLKAAKLLVAEGATFIGRCEVGPGTKAGAAPASEPGVRPVAVAAGARR